MSEVWPSLFRISVGLYWLYFASQKWQGIAWMKPVLDSAARANPIPGLHEVLVSVVYRTGFRSHWPSQWPRPSPPCS